MSQPCAGQIDGVALASAFRFSTLRANRLQPRFEALEQRAEQAERVFGIRQRRERPRVGRFLLLGRLRRRDAAAHGAGLHQRRQLLHRPRQARVERGLRAKIGDGRLKRFDLTGEFCGGGAVAGVFELEGLLAGVQTRDVALGLPGGADANQHRQGHHRAGNRDGGPRRDRHSANHTRRAVGDQNGVTP